MVLWKSKVQLDTDQSAPRENHPGGHITAGSNLFQPVPARYHLIIKIQNSPTTRLASYGKRQEAVVLRGCNSKVLGRIYNKVERESGVPSLKVCPQLSFIVVSSGGQTVTLKSGVWWSDRKPIWQDPRLEYCPPIHFKIRHVRGPFMNQNQV